MPPGRGQALLSKLQRMRDALPQWPSFLVVPRQEISCRGGLVLGVHVDPWLHRG